MTENQLKSKLELVANAIYDVLKETGDSIPSGHLYAILMEKGCDLPTFDRLIRYMESSGMIRVENHLITIIER